MSQKPGNLFLMHRFELIFLFLFTTLLELHSQHKGSNTLSMRGSVVDEERMKPDY